MTALKIMAVATTVVATTVGEVPRVFAMTHVYMPTIMYAMMEERELHLTIALLVRIAAIAVLEIPVKSPVLHGIHKRTPIMACVKMVGRIAAIVHAIEVRTVWIVARTSEHIHMLCGYI